MARVRPKNVVVRLCKTGADNRASKTQKTSQPTTKLCLPLHAVSNLLSRSGLVVKLMRAEAFTSFLQRRKLCATSTLKNRNRPLLLERTSSVDSELNMNAKNSNNVVTSENCEQQPRGQKTVLNTIKW